jgi:hypothetical protein
LDRGLSQKRADNPFYKRVPLWNLLTIKPISVRWLLRWWTQPSPAA